MSEQEKKMSEVEKKVEAFVGKCVDLSMKLLDRMDAIPKAFEKALERGIGMAERGAERTEERLQVNHTLDLLKTNVEMIRLQQTLEVDRHQHEIQVKRLQAELDGGDQTAPKFGGLPQK